MRKSRLRDVEFWTRWLNVSRENGSGISSERIFESLGLKDAAFDVPPNKMSGVAWTYQHEHGRRLCAFRADAL